MTLLTQKHPTNPPTVLRASKNNLSGSQTERYFSLLYNYDDDQEILERGFAKEGLLLFTYILCAQRSNTMIIIILHLKFYEQPLTNGAIYLEAVCLVTEIGSRPHDINVIRF